MRKLPLIKKSTCYRLTWFGRLVTFLILSISIISIGKLLPYYLSINKPVNGQLLVLDGQMPDYAVVEAIKVFENGDYDMIITTGSNLPEGFYVSGMKTMAELSRQTFIALGFDSTKVKALPTKFVRRNRTFNSANTLNEWLIDSNTNINSVDILTIGCHARRSLFLFSKALNEQVEVGTVTIPNKGYDLDSWWKTSIGARVTISETIAFFYVVLTS